MRDKDYSGDVKRTMKFQEYSTKAFRAMYEQMWDDADVLADTYAKLQSNDAKRSLRTLEKYTRDEARVYADLAKIKTFEIEDEDSDG